MDLLRVGWFLVALAIPAGIVAVSITESVEDWSFSTWAVLGAADLAGLLALVLQRRLRSLLLLGSSLFMWWFVTLVGALSG